ncbi:TetR/AcrR family transcriptional regulator [Streptacidiphilus jiangxiensis]|uniref:DNA-binding transcriptional regulator, AcrR family n=1 Tax=Streptacidiphilus jiangxiensis TaxID=235985 RepID=A0A1H7K050_STRJI|nr:TetR/AcrR family transcriptional regulator [Streptacidiphilus jiangxiensis]SEK80142.1 DNA-binding transcriptional regulator, AcrR family [Streptacidiphilus jiangxiensis]
MVQQEQVLPRAVDGTIPVQRGIVANSAGRGAGAGTNGTPGGRLRVDARRNLEAVLRAAREVFGELGYGAPMEEVARRAGVGVGTVYRRFPSKEVLVRRIASEEVVWLTQQAREAISIQTGGAGGWEALASFLARAASSGAGRLLPPETFRQAEALVRVPVQRTPGASEEPAGPAATDDEFGADADPARLLELLAELVEGARVAGELRPGVTVADVVLVLTAAVPQHTSSDGSASGRLLQLLLDGLRN